MQKQLRKLLNRVKMARTIDQMTKYLRKRMTRFQIANSKS